MPMAYPRMGRDRGMPRPSIKLSCQRRHSGSTPRKGDDGRVYPWGNDFDKNRCNTDESGIGKTTPVTRYEGQGDSPFGVTDMSGNVREWCLTEYKSGSDTVEGDARRVLRGGSWYYDQLSCARRVSRLQHVPTAVTIVLRVSGRVGVCACRSIVAGGVADAPWRVPTRESFIGA